MAFCSNCGAPATGGEYCGSCGGSLSASGSDTPTTVDTSAGTPVPAGPPAPARQRKSKLGLWLAIGSAVALVALGLAAYRLFFQSSGSTLTGGDEAVQLLESAGVQCDDGYDVEEDTFIDGVSGCDLYVVVFRDADQTGETPLPVPPESSSAYLCQQLLDSDSWEYLSGNDGDSASANYQAALDQTVVWGGNWWALDDGNDDSSIGLSEEDAEEVARALNGQVATLREVCR